MNHCSHSSFLLETSGWWLLLQVLSPEAALPIPIHLLWGQEDPHNRETPQICQGMKTPMASCTPCSGVSVTPSAAGATCQPRELGPASGCCRRELPGCLLVTSSETVGEKMNVPEDSHTAVPSPSKAEPGGRAGQGAVAHGHS